MASPCWCEVLLGAAYVKDEAGALRETPDEDAKMLGPAEEVLAVFHRVVEVVLPWNSEVSEFKLQLPPALPTHRDHPQPDAPTPHKGLFLKGPTGFGL